LSNSPSILKKIVDREKDNFEKYTYYGVPVSELTKDELMAALVCLMKAIHF